MNHRKFVSSVLSAAIVLSFVPCAQSADDSAVVCSAADSVITVAEHSQDEIRKYVKEHSFDITSKDTYKVEPSTVSPFVAGVPDDSAIQNALNYLNCIRYVAGVQEVTLNKEYCEYAQAAALVNCVNNKQTHFPTQPDGMPDDLYNLGAQGAGSSNLCPINGANVAYTIDYYMHDSSSSNMKTLGHRRWCLNPTMAETGFGFVGDHSAMYAFNMANTNGTETGVCWPAHNTPVEYFNAVEHFGQSTIWSFSLGDSVDAYNINVKLVRKSDSQTWNFNSSSTGGNYFNVNNDPYGQKGCIMFRPSGVSYNDGDIFDVTITGIDSSPVTYSVNFFSLGDIDTDGRIDACDASAALIEYATVSTGGEGFLTDEQKRNADIDGNKMIDASDASYILEYYGYVSTNNDTVSMEEWLKTK